MGGSGHRRDRSVWLRRCNLFHRGETDMTKDEALKMALEALMYASYEDIEYDATCAAKVLSARNAIKAALAQPEQEADAVDVLTEEGWIWDDDQWQRPTQPEQDIDYWIKQHTEARQAELELRRELEALKSEQEPVAWMYTSKWKGNERFITRFQTDLSTYKADEVWPLYTSPPQRQPLMDKDILADETLRYYFGQNGGAGPVSKQGRKVVDAIEAAHGIGDKT